MTSKRNWVIWIACFGMLAPIAMTLGPDFVWALRSYTWKKAPCRILRSSVTEEPFSATVMHYKVSAEYSYDFDRRAYRATRFTTGEHEGSTDPASAQQAVTRLAPGSTSTCYVNPRNPSEAVLERGRIWTGLFLLGPFLIVGLMAHEEIFAWFEERNRRRRGAVPLPLSETNEAMQLDKRTLLFAILGLTMGIFFAGFCILGPVWQSMHARDWVETDGKLTRSELTSRSGLHGPEYSLEVAYDYQFDGQPYRSTQRTFTGLMEEPVTDLAQWAASHRTGTPVRVFVDPHDPARAVLSRTLHFGWVSVSIAFLMLSFGSLMAFQCVRTWWQRNHLHGAALLEGCLGKQRDRPSRLKVFPPPMVSAAGCALAAIAAGAAGGWSLFKGVRALMDGHGDIINLLYGAVAAFGAVYMAGCAARFFRKAFHSRPQLELTPGTPLVGRLLKLKWRFIGPQQPVGWVRIALEGYEEARVRRLIAGLHGPISEEKKERLQFTSLLMADEPGTTARSGSVSVALPADTMHSFFGTKAGICWEIKFEFGKDPNERLEYRFPIRLMPARS